MLSVLKRNLLQTYEEQYEARKDGDPYDVIPVKNKKHAKNTTEVCLSNRNVNRLINFDGFPNLEVVWLNNNALSSIEGLSSNFRLKELYLRSNELERLDVEDFKGLKNLVLLDLGQNRLFEFEESLRVFRLLRYLRNLNLNGNPIGNALNFRYRMIYHLPNLDILNGVKVKDEERKKAADLFGKDNAARPKKHAVNNVSPNERILIQKYKHVLKQRFKLP